jgi:hypothetical protein
MPYELFHNKAVKFGSAQLTIRGGRIAFNAAAGDILATVGMRFAHLLFDVDRCKVAIRPIKKQDEHAFAVSVPKGKRGGTISAQSFLNYIRWHAKKPVVVDAQWNASEQLMEASLPAEHCGPMPCSPGATAATTGTQERPSKRMYRLEQ